MVGTHVRDGNAHTLGDEFLAAGRQARIRVLTAPEDRMAGNPICHIEIPTNDLDGSMAFYERVFDWKMSKMGDDYAIFAILGDDGKPVMGGGIDPSRDPISSNQGIVFYVECHDIDVTLGEIEAAGGTTVTGKTRISPEHGFYALFEDPSGGRLGLWSRV